VPFFGVATAIYYNKDIYDKLGLTPPETWNEFMANCAAIKEAGIAPVAFMAQKRDAIGWINTELVGGLVGQKLLEDPELNFNGDSSISNFESAKAKHTGHFDLKNNTELRELYKIYLKHLEEYVQYCPNASGLDEAAAKAMFLSGNAAHIHTGSWDLKSFCDEEMTFKAATFPFPNFTKDNSPYAGIGLNPGAVQPLAVTSSALSSEGKKEAVIDFLMFFTSPKVYGDFAKEAYQVPVVKGVEGDELFNGFIKDGRSAIHMFRSGAASKAAFTFYNAEMAVIAGEKSADDEKMIDQVSDSIRVLLQEVIDMGEMTPDNDFKVPTQPFLGEAVAPTR